MSEANKRNLMAIDDLGDELGDIIDWAISFKHGGEFSRDFKPLDGMSIGSIYEKPSTRTRVSFEVGVSRLGGQPLTLLSNDIQLGKSESIADTAAVLSRFLDGITYRCFEHGHAEELAQRSAPYTLHKPRAPWASIEAGSKEAKAQNTQIRRRARGAHDGGVLT